MKRGTNIPVRLYMYVFVFGLFLSQSVGCYLSKEKLTRQY